MGCVLNQNGVIIDDPRIFFKMYLTIRKMK